jgi:hypothetical protein
MFAIVKVARNLNLTSLGFECCVFSLCTQLFLIVSSIQKEWASNIMLIFGLHFAWNVSESVLFNCVNSGAPTRVLDHQLNQFARYIILDYNLQNHFLTLKVF